MIPIGQDNKYSCIHSSAETLVALSTQTHPNVVINNTRENCLSHYSLLNAYDRKLVNESGVTLGALQHICLGSSSDKDDGVGWNEKNASPYFLKLFQLFSNRGGLFTKNCFPSVLIPICNQIDSFWKRFEKGDYEVFANEISYSILALKPGESYVMRSGYAGRPSGHSMIIRFKKSEIRNNYTIYLYNGNGEEWELKKTKDHKLYIHPYLTFDQVQIEELFFTSNFSSPDPIIILNLLKVQTPTERGDLNFHSVMSLLAPIRHRLTSSNRCSQLFIALQQGHNCVAKSFNCLLLDLVPNRNHYKRITLDNRFHTILFYFLTHRDKLSTDQREAFRLKQAVMNFMRMVHSHFQRGTIEQVEYYQAVATFQEIIETLAIFPEKEAKTNLSSSINEKQLLAQNEKARILRVKNASKTAYRPIKNASPISEKDINPQLGINAGWKQLSDILNEIFTFIRHGNNNNLVFQIEFLMQNLQDLKNLFCPLGKSNPKIILKSLNIIAEHYVKALYSLKMAQSCASQNAIMEMLAIGYCLALKCDEDRLILQNFGIYYDYFDRQASLFLFAMQDPLQLKQRNKLIAFFSALPSDWKLFNFKSENFDHDRFCRGEMPESQLFQLYIPDISQEKRMKCYEEISELDESFGYIKNLASIAGLATSLFHCHDPLEGFSSFPTRYLFPNGWIKYVCGSFYWSSNSDLPEDFSSEYTEVDKNKKLPPCFEVFSKSRLWSHDPQKLLTENEWQGESALEGQTKRKVFAPLCEPEVKISLFLKTWTEQIEILFDPEWRLVFENLLFKTHLKKKETCSPLFNHIERDPYFALRIEKLTQEGFRNVKHLPFREEHLQIFLGFLSIMRMRSSLLYLMRTINKEMQLSNEILRQRKELLNWIQRIFLSQLCTGPLKSEFLLVKTAVLMEQSLAKMTSDERADLAISYCTLQPNLGVSQKGESPVLRREIQRRWLAMAPEWMHIFRNSSEIFKFFQIIAPQISGSALLPLFNGRLSDFRIEVSHTWWFDFGKAQIGNQSGQWNPHQIELPHDSKMQRLFSNRKHHLSSFGQTISFIDPVWGKIKINLAHDMIEREDRGKWYQYEHLNDSLFTNTSLQIDYALWKSPDSPSHYYFCDLKGGKPCYILHEDGRLCSIEDEKEFVIRGIQEFSIYENIKGFENLWHISCFVDKQSRWSIEFPRFKTCLGGVLRFGWNNEKELWHFFENAAYFLDPNPLVEWGFDECLNLINQDGTQQLVLVPMGEISSEGFSPKCKITLPPIDQSGNKGALTYFEYEVKNNELVSRSINGQLYLGTLTLACKQYQNALNIFRGISLSAVPDKITWKLCNSLISSAKAFTDPSPNAKAVLLHVYHFFLNLDPYASLLLEEKFLNTIKSLYNSYLCSLANIESPLLLSREEELDVIQSLKDESYHGREQQLNFQSFDEPLIEKIISEPSTLGICNGFFPHCITHLYSENANKDYYLKLRSDPEFEKRLATLYQDTPQSHRWRGMIYRLATQKNHSLTDQFILFFAHVYEQTRSKISLPPLYAADEVIREWYEYLNYWFHQSRTEKDCHKPCNHVALEFKVPDKYKMDSTPGQILSPKVSSPSSPLSLPKFGESDGEDALIPIQRNYLIQENPLLEIDSIDDQQAIVSLPHADLKYAGSINAMRAFYLKDRQFADFRQKSRSQLKPDSDFSFLAHQLKELIKNSIETEKTIEKSIWKLANHQPIEKLTLAYHHAIAIGNGLKKSNLADLCRWAVQEKWQNLFKKMNLHLDLNGIKLLQQWTIELMLHQTKRAQLHKVLEAVQSCLLNPDKTNLDQAAYELSQIRAYNPKASKFPLLFEYMSGLRLRLQQAQIIEKVLPLLTNRPEIAGIAFQAMMNGGKSSVIISNLVEIASEAGFISCIFSHYSQLASMKGNLQSYQKTRFNKDLLHLPYQLKDLGEVKTLEIIKNRLQEAKRKRCGIIMKSTFPPIVQLKFILECFRLKGIDSAAKLDHLKYLEQLAEILTLFEKDIVSFIDECDLVLHLMTEVNVPFGESKTIAPERVDLVAAIYLILIDPEIRDKLNLHKDMQKDVQQEILVNEIFPFAAEKLFHDPAFDLEQYPHLKEAFKKHLRRPITVDEQNQAQEDQHLADNLTIPLDSIQDQSRREYIELLRLMERRSLSHDRYEKESAEAVGLARHMFLTVLPKVFQKSFNRHYGHANPEYRNGEIIPYQGPDAPAKTRFGYVYLSLASHLQAALGGGIAQEEISFLAGKMLAAAQNFANQEKISLLDTEEAKQFHKLTGIFLNEASIPEKLSEAHRFVNDPNFPKRSLKIRQEVAPFHVRYYPLYVSSNPINQIEHIAKPIACSGARWNSPSFHPKVGKMYSDEGAEGAIINAIEERDQISSCMYEVPDASLKALIEVIQKHPYKRRVRAIIDGGGFVKECKRGAGKADGERGINSTAAALLKFFHQEPDTEIEGVLYLHRFSNEEAEEGLPEEAFVVAKKGEKLPLILENTTPEAIAKAGIPLERLFFFIEEMLGTGLDCKMAPDTICLQTIDLDVPMRTLLQNSQRPRDFFKKQHIDFCVLKEGIEKVLGGNRSMKCVHQHLMMNEGKMISDLILRSYHLQLPNIPRAYAIRELCTAAISLNGNKINSLTDQFQEYLLSSREEEKLWASFGRIKSQTPAIAFLKQKSSQCFKTLVGINDQIASKYAESAIPILQNAENEVRLPAVVEIQEVEKLDNEVELVHEEEIQLDLDKDLTINQELNEDLHCYNLVGTNSTYFIDKKWSLQIKEDRLLRLKDLLEDIQPLKVIFQNKYPLINQMGFVTTAEYAECFEENLYMTTNLEKVYNISTPLLHKETKPVDFLLIVEEEGQCHFIFVSKRDGSYFKEWILKNHPLNAWLVNLEGIPEAENQPGSFMKKREKNKRFDNKIQDGLWQANFYQGNIRYMEEQPQLSVQKIQGKKRLFGKYLALKNAYDTGRLHATFRSFLLDTQNLSSKKESGLLFSSRRQLIKKTYIEFQQFPREQVEQIDPSLVTNLRPQQIPWLTTTEQVSNLYPDAVNSLVPEQMTLINDCQIKYLTIPALLAVLPSHQVKHLDREQVKSLKTADQIAALPDKYLNSISAECVKLLEPAKVPFLKHAHLIQAIPPQREDLIQEIPLNKVCCILKEQVPALKREQVENLSRGLIDGITDEQFAWLKDEQLPYLRKKELIERIPLQKINLVEPAQIPCLNETQVKALPDNCLDFIEPHQVPFIENNKITLLTREALIAAIAHEKVAAHIGEHQVAHLVGRQIEQVPSQWIHLLKPLQVPHLTADQIKAIPDNDAALIQAIPACKIPEIRPAHVPHLTPDQIKSLPHDDEALIQRISIERMQEIIPEYVRHLTGDQIQNIPLDRPDLIEQIPNDKLCYLLPGQIRHLNAAQIIHLPDGMLNELLPFQIPFVPAVKIHLFTKPELIEQIPLDKIPYVSAGQIPHLSDSKLPYLPIDFDILNSVPEERKKHLSDLQLNELYSPKNLSDMVLNIVQGLFATLFGIAIQLPILLAFHLVWSAILTVISLFSEEAAEMRDRQLVNTFVNIPMQKITLVKIIYDYPGYKRSSWEWETLPN